MEKFMNKPVEYKFTDKDILDEYNKYKDTKKIAKIFGIPVKEVKEILKHFQ